MSGQAEAFNSELDYLWDAVRQAQDAYARAELDRTEARSGLEHTVSNMRRLERELELSAARERSLKEETAKLSAALKKDNKMLAAAARGTDADRTAVQFRAEIDAKLLDAQNRGALLETQIARLSAETGALRAVLKGREEEIDALKKNISGLASLPELARVLERDSRASGKSKQVYEHLVACLEQEKRRALEAAGELNASAAETARAAETMEALEKENSRLHASITDKLSEVTALEAAFARSVSEGRLTAEELAALTGRAVTLATELGEKETALEQALLREGLLRRELAAAATEARRLREAAGEQALKTEEQKNNFAGAVGQVFELQSRAAALRSELAAEKEKNTGLVSALEKTEADLEKVNGLLHGTKTGLIAEKETAKRALAKMKTLETAIEDLKGKVSASQDYSGRLIHAVEERDRRILSLSEELKTIDALKMENDDLRRRNLKFSGLIKREQAEFTARMIAGLEKTTKNVKMFNSRVAPAERKSLESAIKELQGAVDLMKGWKEYIDEETPELQETDLGPFCLGEVRKWERQFKLRGISLASAASAPRLRARIEPGGMKMLIYQLLKNACEHLSSGASLRVLLKASEDGRQAVMSFEDTGPGFPLETLEKLFMPFNTTEKGKTGIGLALARRIAEKHGGTLEVSNRKERGAAVELRLPLTAPPNDQSVAI